MLIDLPHPRKLLSYIHWSEKYSHVILPVRKLSFSKWLLLQQVANYFGTSKEELLYRIMQSRQLHAIRNGDNVYVHPDGVQSYLRSRGKARVKAIASRIYRKYLQGHQSKS